MATPPPLQSGPHLARAFGVLWNADLALRHFDRAETGEVPGPAITVRRVAELPSRQGIARRQRGQIFADGFRFAWESEATFDFHAPNRIDYLPGPDWHGSLPDSFYSTAAALALCWNGMLPIHASAVEWRGQAYLLAGKAGAGKSTLTAELLAHGARLVGDDLTVLAPATGGGFEVLPGRPAMRLHPDTADAVAASAREAVPQDPRGKLLVRPVARSTASRLPLAGIILLGGLTGRLSPLQAVRMLPPHQFRPRWSALIPGHGQRLAWLVELAGTVPVTGLSALSGFDDAARLRRFEAAIAALSG